jgi:L-serine/L-threonine ammonia-lyase
MAVETKGAESLAKSLEAGQLVKLDGITSIATTLGARQVCRQAFEFAKQSEIVSSVVLTDSQTVKACKRFADDERILVEPACGVCLAVCYEGLLPQLVTGFSRDSNVVVVVCGGSNVSVDIINGYMEKYG